MFICTKNNAKFYFLQTCFCKKIHGNVQLIPQYVPSYCFAGTKSTLSAFFGWLLRYTIRGYKRIIQPVFFCCKPIDNACQCDIIIIIILRYLGVNCALLTEKSGLEQIFKSNESGKYRKKFYFNRRFD